MSYKDLKYYDEYISHKMDLLIDFYLPVLSNTVLFNRAVGYFRGNFIYEISKGMSALINNNGKVNIITSPDLTEEDIEKIENGYELKKLIEEKMHEVVQPPMTQYEYERTNYIANLIASNHLDIKIAVTKELRNNGIFHEKWGVLTDFEGNKISMIGSNNDTYNGLLKNHESFELNFSWEGKTDVRKIAAKEKRFLKMWENLDESLIIINLPPNITEEILKYKKESIVPEEGLVPPRIIIERRVKKMNDIPPDVLNIPHTPKSIEIRDYQWDAYFKWKDNCYKGIFSMATGTGKTIAALNSLVQLFNSNEKLFVIIVCPYQHLVEQWVEDLERFNIIPIVGYSQSKQKTWRHILKNQVQLFNYSNEGRFCCFITTNATYNKELTQKVLADLKGEILFIVDEAHNIGTEIGLNGLLDNYKYRLALSATFKRKYDEEGTKALRDYFGDVVYEIGIKEAIFKWRCLVEYEYHPVPTFLTDNEFETYKELTRRIAKGTQISGNKSYFSNDAKLAANLRSLVIAGSIDKISKLSSFIPELKNSKNNLIYCGAAMINLEEMPEEIKTDEMEYRQVDLVRDILVNNDIVAARFTAAEDIQQRKFIKEQFANGTIGTVVAIKCLDEGVNIPSIERAYILASSKDEKQYIQRRGRVLRKYEYMGINKEKAYIYDFISLPYKIDYTNNINESDQNTGRSLVESELLRMEEFYDTCSNQEKVLSVIKELIEAYKITKED